MTLFNLFFSFQLLASDWLDLQKVFSASPFIYAVLAILSVSSLSIWLYSLATFRIEEVVPSSFKNELSLLLQKQDWEKATRLCNGKPNFLASIIKTGLMTRGLGPQVMMDAMKTEGKRVSTPFWQRLSLLNDIAIVAPMLGLLGTVVGMFYAFYDVNRSVESINALFDGLGIAVGTTVFGLVVAILSMLFATTLKYRLIKTLTRVETEALAISSMIPPERGPWS
jgi:biopolymer transport protein ExbB